MVWKTNFDKVDYEEGKYYGFTNASKADLDR